MVPFSIQRRASQSRDDDGLTLIEMIVAMTVFAVMATVTSGLLINTLKTSANNKQRVVADNLAQTQIESARSLRALDIPDGASAPVTSTVGGTTYTVNQTVDVVASDSTTSICQGSGNAIGYKLVTVVVTWPNMGNTRPVRADTLKALGVGNDGLDASKGAAAVAVLDANGNPQQGITVTLIPSNQQRTTGVDGCAVYTSLNPGNYTASMSKAGYVTADGAASFTTAAVGVRASTVTRTSVAYDVAGGLAATFTYPTGFAPVSNLAVTLSNTNFTPSTYRPFLDCSLVSTSPQTCVSGSPRTASALFPGKYGVWAGTCNDAVPNPLPNLTTVMSTTTSAVSVPLGGVTVQVKDTNNNLVTGKTLYAYHASDSQCGVAEVYLLNSGSASSVQVSLPRGTWTFALNNTASSPPASTGSWPTATIVSGSTVSTPVVVRTS